MLKFISVSWVRLVALSCVVLSQQAFAVEPTVPETLGEPTPLLGITAVDDVMSPVEEPNASEGGAMDMNRMFSTTVVSELNNCLKQTHGAFVQWYKKHQLLPASEKLEKYKMKSLIWDKEQQGVFEAGYELNKEKQFIRVFLNYYRLDGRKLTPTSIPALIETYQISALWDQLAEVIECDA